MAAPAVRAAALVVAAMAAWPAAEWVVALQAGPAVEWAAAPRAATEERAARNSDHGATMGRTVSGVGVSLRREHYDDALATKRRVDWIEIQPENFMGFGGLPRAVLERAASKWPIVPHGVGLSLGGPDPLSRPYLAALRAMVGQLDCAYFSEHASFSSARGVSFHGLYPLPFTEEAAAHLGRRAAACADELGIPVLLENITYYGQMPGSAISEGAFLSEALEISGAGLLLDLNNVYVNAMNLGVDLDVALASLPLERTRQIHLAGHTRERGRLIDDHGGRVPEVVWDLYRKAVRRLGPIPTIIEWENKLESFDALLDEADKARAIQRELAPIASMPTRAALAW